MSGKEESKIPKLPNPAKEELKKWDKILDEYENSVGLPTFLNEYRNIEATEYMHMTRGQIEKLSPQDCASAALILNELSFHVQRAYNREIARVNWAEDTIKSLIANDVQNYKGYSYAERLEQAVKNNSHASKLKRIKVYAKQRSDRMVFLSSSINNRSDIFLAIQRAKRVNNV
tara:strand:- start:52642 stop:53160 length:519 start_codon:yes stop_codon:yes gene_type:complete